MLPETASSIGDRPAARTAYRGTGEETSVLHDQIRQQVMRVFMIEREQFTFDEQAYARIMRHNLLVDPTSRLTAMFEGRLVIDSETAYEQLDQAFTEMNQVPLFREDEGKHIIYVVAGRVKPRPRPYGLNIILFVLTILSVMWLGAEIAISQIADTDPALGRQLTENFTQNPLSELLRGWPYAVCIILILGAHELGHYFAARRHKLAVTLPYFIPMPPFLLPTPFGTFGAFIQLREPMRNRKVLLDVGAAGPYMGLVFAIPILFIGLATSPIKDLLPGMVYSMEGNSLLYALAKTIIFGHFLPNGVQDVFLNQVAWAGWTGLLITALNLIPIGQLDGGHMLYSLIGRRARTLYYPLMGLALLLVFTSETWIFWFILLLLFGRMYAVPLDDITPLDNRRKFLSVLGLIVFVVTFIPVPFAQVTVPNLGSRDSVMMLPAVVTMLTLWTSRHLRR
ncbi:MAG: site-2 protease family protein [Anaerolineae bacterium]